MKRITVILLSVLILMSITLSASAYVYEEGDRTALVNDFAEIIPDYDEETLNFKLEQISETYECEVAVLTVNSTDGYDITAFADDYYDYNGFGWGENDDGIMLVVDMGNREFAITTYGTAIDIFTDYNLAQLESVFVPYLSEGSYTDAFIAYYEKCINVFDDYNTYLNDYGGEGNVYIPSDDDYIYDDGYNDIYEDDYYTPHKSPLRQIFSVKWLVISVIIGLVIAFFYTSFLKSQLKTVKSKPSASDYVIPGSFNLTGQRDVFLYRNVKKTPKPKNNNTGSRGGSSFGGGSSTHRSSSGRTHGGSRGSF